MADYPAAAVLQVALKLIKIQHARELAVAIRQPTTRLDAIPTPCMQLKSQPALYASMHVTYWPLCLGARSSSKSSRSMYGTPALTPSL